MKRDVRNLLNKRIFLLDVEGDGRSGGGVPVETSLIEVEGGRFVAEHRWLTNPGGRIGSYATAVHGITNEMVANCPRLEEVADEISSVMMGQTIVGLSVSNDLNMLRKGIPSIDFVCGDLVDIQKLTYLAPSGRKNMGLANLCNDLGIDMAFDLMPFGERSRMHGSSADAWLTSRCLFALIERLQAFGSWAMVKDASLRCFIEMSPEREAMLRKNLEARGLDITEGRKP